MAPFLLESVYISSLQTLQVRIRIRLNKSTLVFSNILYNARRVEYILWKSMTVAQFEELSLTLGIGGLILYMMFILYDLGKQSNAGAFGMFVLFMALGMGIVGFAAKSVIKMAVEPDAAIVVAQEESKQLD
jgi:hypothetical protein